MSNLLYILTTAYVLILCLLCYISINSQLKKTYYIPVKMVCSGFFILLYTYMEIEATGSALHAFALPLLFCFLGDLFMGLYNIKRKKAFMLLGIGTFMVAHVAFILIFYYFDSLVDGWNFIIPLICLPASILVIKAVHLHLGKLKPAVVFYSLFIGSLMAKTTQIGFLHTLPNYAFLIGLGGILFFLSDFILMFVYFYHFHSRKSEKTMHVLNLVTYYLAILLIEIGFIVDKL